MHLAAFDNRSHGVLWVDELVGTFPFGKSLLIFLEVAFDPRSLAIERIARMPRDGDDATTLVMSDDFFAHEVERH